MKSKISAILRVVLAGFLLGQAVRLPAQTIDNNDVRTSRHHLEKEQRTFLIYIQDAENEYTNAVARLSQQNKLWQNNAANAQIRLDVVFTLMDGNQHFAGHQAQIAALKTYFYQAERIRAFTDNYLNMRNRAYDLENRLAKLNVQLSPETTEFLGKIRGQMAASATPEDVYSSGGGGIAAVSQAEAQSTNVKSDQLPGNQGPGGQSPGSQGQGNQGVGNMAPGNPYSVNQVPGNNEGEVVPPHDASKWATAAMNNPGDANVQDNLRKGLTSGPDALTTDEANRALTDLRSGNWKDLADLYRKHPGNQYLRALLENLLNNSNDHPSAAETKSYLDALASGDPGRIAQAAGALAQAHPGNPLFQTGGALSGEGSGSTSDNSSSSSPTTETPNPNPNPIIHDRNGQVVDEREWLDANNRPKKEIVRTTYTDFKGGQIDSERILVSNARTDADGNITIDPTEVPGSKIDWLFTIKQVSSTPAGDGFTVSFELDNDGTPQDAGYVVTAWEGPDGKRESSDSKFTVTFPKSGDYVVKVYGSTSKYHSNFTISLPVKF